MSMLMRMNRSDKRKLILFFTITFTLSWSVWILSGVLSRTEFIYDTPWLISQTGVFAPTLAAAVIMGIHGKDARKKGAVLVLLSVLIFACGFTLTKTSPSSIRDFTEFQSIGVLVTAAIVLCVIMRCRYSYLPMIKRKTHFITRALLAVASVLFLPAVFMLAWLILNISGGTLTIDCCQNGPMRSMQFITVSFSMNLILGGSMGEEFGWRAFALPLLLKKYNPVAASLVLGLIWSMWHLPIDISGSGPAGPAAALFRLVWALPLTIIFTWFFIRTKGSIIIALLLHTSVNVLPDMGFADYEQSIAFMTLFLMIAALIIALRPEMRCTFKEHFRQAQPAE